MANAYNKSQNRPQPYLPQVDWARLAAYIDGEGCISIKANKRPNGKIMMHVEISVSGQDPRLMQWMRERFGGYIGKQKMQPTGRLLFHWYATCGIAHEVLLGCLPYFVIKGNQAEIAIAFRELTGARKWGVKGMPVELKEKQFAFRQELKDSRTLHYEDAVN